MTREEAIKANTEVNAFKASLLPVLTKISTNQNSALVEIDLQDIRFDDYGVGFKAGGHCRGYFEDWFGCSWVEFDQLKHTYGL